jgi:ABC-type cobalamin/Fe3+-siderophores transport system ATPase subunit
MGLEFDVHGLKLIYDTHPVLDGTEFKVEKGDLVALLGANGAGKSTLLRCISRVLKAYRRSNINRWPRAEKPGQQRSGPPDGGSAPGNRRRF